MRSLILFVARHAGEEFVAEYGRPDRRLRIIYDNGTESDLLLRSFQRALCKDEGGVDRRAKVIHSVVATAANAHDSALLGDLLHGAERDVWGDQAYQGQSKVIKKKAPQARDRTNRRHRNQGVVNEAERARNRVKSRVRSRVKHVIGVIKLKFGFTKVRYRSLEKNANRLFATCGLTNLYILRHRFRTA